MDVPRAERIAPIGIEVRIDKFLDYVLVPGHHTGKDRIFLGRFGFRPSNREDAQLLVNLYAEQAATALERGDYALGVANDFGRPCTMVTVVRGTAIRSGWLLRHDGILALATPFSGFVRQKGARS